MTKYQKAGLQSRKTKGQVQLDQGTHANKQGKVKSNRKGLEFLLPLKIEMKLMLIGNNSTILSRTNPRSQTSYNPANQRTTLTEITETQKSYRALDPMSNRQQQIMKFQMKKVIMKAYMQMMIMRKMTL